MNPIQTLINRKRDRLLSLFFTAGYPYLNSTADIIAAAEEYGIDFLEVGMPYSDPLADGPVIQHSSTQAIANGMTINLVLDQLAKIKGKHTIPLLLMGYLNPVWQYGTERFLEKAAEVGVSGIILPDLPMEDYEDDYQRLFDKHGLSMIFLLTPQTSEQRIRKIDSLSNAFIYTVSSAATTGNQQSFGQAQQSYFEKLRNMNLKNPLIAGFGIHNHQTLQQAWNGLNGAICGSAFLKKLEQNPNPREAIALLLKDLGLKKSDE